MITAESIKCTKIGSREARIFRSVNAAATGIGVTEGAIRYAMKKEGRCCKGWVFERVPSVFLVKMADDGNYYLCELADGGGGFDVLGEDGGFLQDQDVAEFWDVTENFNRIRNGREEI